MTNRWNTWTAFLTTSTTMSTRVEKALKTHAQLTLSEYDVLITIYNSDNHSLSFSNLGTTVLVTTSGLSRAVTRLVDRGILTKTTCPTDKRACTLTLTDDGITLATTARDIHDRIVTDNFFDAFTDTELAQLGELLTTLNNHHNQD